MRAGLLRFLNHYEGNTSKYSEPITVFYIDRIVEKLNEFGPEVSLVEKCNNVLAAGFPRLKVD